MSPNPHPATPRHHCSLTDSASPSPKFLSSSTPGADNIWMHLLPSCLSASLPPCTGCVGLMSRVLGTHSRHHTASGFSYMYTVECLAPAPCLRRGCLAGVALPVCVQAGADSWWTMKCRLAHCSMPPLKVNLSCWQLQSRCVRESQGSLFYVCFHLVQSLHPLTVVIWERIRYYKSCK